MDNVPWQSLTDQTKPTATKVRLANVYKRPGQKLVEVMAELKDLTEKDLQDFRDQFNAAGFPTTEASGA